ncbi:uncharacterized protein HKW66_Vig0150720 [Vigna angularis]|uniref:Uncharacterized protein n=1 Tax=Phaseolus angularis TaxID=3914 RepID=A0A8T0JUX4_PHAAN|nr:uncharacterized protein HKW66_Vig0150720 [Vigna angularis]
MSIVDLSSFEESMGRGDKGSVEQGKKLATMREDIIKAHKLITNLRVQLKEATIAHTGCQKKQEEIALQLQETHERKFEVMKDVYHGKLVNIQDISSNKYVEVESNVEVVAEYQAAEEDMEDGGNHLHIVSVTEKAGAIIYHYYSLSFIGFVESP